MTEFETKLIALLTEAVEEMGNLRCEVTSIYDMLSEIHREQCFPGDRRRQIMEESRKEARKNASNNSNDPPIPF